MVAWGKGLMQSDDDYDIANDLSDMCDCDLIYPTEDEGRSETIKKLNDGLFSQKLEKILAADFRPATSYHKRERIAIIFTMLAMELGVIIEPRYLRMLKVLRPMLPTLEQQLQLVTALDEYKNDGTPWETGSKGLIDTKKSAERGPNKFDLGDEFWFSGLGFSSDEVPASEMVSKVCMNCGERDVDLRCSRCKMARYCDANCQRAEWPLHKKVCQPREGVRRCPVPDLTPE
ncbi:hypothetical protein F4774DRAFT_407591 [Daldinia eschscholtzii]|nr:hypothetical protein F4774DRAFT_407591 [Daldinia eschscholtzii]